MKFTGTAAPCILSSELKATNKQFTNEDKLVWSDEVERSSLALDEVCLKSHDDWWSINPAISCDQPPVAPPVGIYSRIDKYTYSTTRPFGDVWVVRQNKEKKCRRTAAEKGAGMQSQQNSILQQDQPITFEGENDEIKKQNEKRRSKRLRKRRIGMMKSSRRKRRQAAAKRRKMLRNAAQLKSNVERKKKIRQQIDEKYMSKKSEAEKKAKMEAARKATVERDAELDIAEISHIDMIKVIETIAILEDDEAQAAHARKSEMSWEDLNGLFNEICNATQNEELKVLTQKYLTKRKEADEKNMEHQISVQENDTLLSVQTSDDMAKDILENLEKLMEKYNSKKEKNSTCYLTNDELSSEDKIEDISEDETEHEIYVSDDENIEPELQTTQENAVHNSEMEKAIVNQIFEEILDAALDDGLSSEEEIQDISLDGTEDEIYQSDDEDTEPEVQTTQENIVNNSEMEKAIVNQIFEEILDAVFCLNEETIVQVEDIGSDLSCSMGMQMVLSERGEEKAEYITGLFPLTERGEATSNERVVQLLGLDKATKTSSSFTNDCDEEPYQPQEEDETCLPHNQPLQPETTNEKLKTVIGGNPNVMLFEIHNVEVHNDILGREATARARVEDVQSLRGQQESFDVIERAPVSDLENFNKQQQNIEKKVIEEEIKQLGDPDPKGDLTTTGNCEAIYRNAQHMHHQSQCHSQAHTARQSKGGANGFAEKFTQLFPQRSGGKRRRQRHGRQTTHSHHYGANHGAQTGFDGFKLAEDLLSLLVHKEDSTKPYVMQVQPQPFLKAMGLPEKHCFSPKHLEVIEKNQLEFSSLKNPKDRKAYYKQAIIEQYLRGGVKGRQEDGRKRQNKLKMVSKKQMKSYMHQLQPVDQPDGQLGTTQTVTAEIHHEPSRPQSQVDNAISNKFSTITESGVQVRSAMVDSILTAHPSFELQVGGNIFCTQPKTGDMLCSVHSTVTALLNLDSVRHAASKSTGPIGDTLTRLATSTVIESEKSSLVESLAAECSSNQDGRIDQGQDAAIFMQTLLEKLCSEDPDANHVFNQQLEDASTCICCGGQRTVERHQLISDKPNRSIAADPKTIHGCIKGINCADGEISRTTLLNRPDTIVQVLACRLASETYKRREEVPYQIHNGQYELKWGIVHLGTSPGAGHFITVITNPLDRHQCLLVDNGRVMWMKKEDFEKVVTQSYIIGYESVAPKTIPEPSSEEILNKMRAATKISIRQDKALQSNTFLQGVKINIQLCWKFIDRSYNHEEAKKALTEMLRKKTYGNANLPLLTEEEEANRAAHQLYKRISGYEPKRWSVWKHIKSTLGLYDDKIIRNIEYIEKVCSKYKNTDGRCINKEGVSVKKSKVFGTGVKPKKGTEYKFTKHAERVADGDDGKPMWKCIHCQFVQCKAEIMKHHRRGRCSVLRQITKHFQITPRNIARGFWSNETTHVKVAQQHDRGNTTRYSIVQEGEEFSCVIQTISPTGFQYPNNQGTETSFGKAWDGRGHSGNNELLAAGRECVYFKDDEINDDEINNDEINDDVTSEFSIWSLLGQLYSIKERKEDDNGVNLNVSAHPAKDPKNRKLEKEFQLIIVASQHEEEHNLKMILRQPGKKDEHLTKSGKMGYGPIENPKPNEDILRSLNNCNVDLYVTKTDLPKTNHKSNDGGVVDPLPNSLETEFQSNWEEEFQSSYERDPDEASFYEHRECSQCRKGWNHVCPFDDEVNGGEHEVENQKPNGVFKFTNHGELICWVNAASQVFFHTMPNIKRDLRRAMEQASHPSPKSDLTGIMLEIITKSSEEQNLNSLRDFIAPLPRSEETGSALHCFEEMVRVLDENAPAAVDGFAFEDERCEIDNKCSKKGCMATLKPLPVTRKPQLLVVVHKDGDGDSAQFSITRLISKLERPHMRNCSNAHISMKPRKLKFNKMPDLFLVHLPDGGSLNQQTSLQVQLDGDTYRAIAVIHHEAGAIGHHYCSLWDAVNKQWLLIDDYHNEASWKRVYQFDNNEKSFKVGPHKLFDKLGVVFYKRQHRDENIEVQEFNGAASRINFHTMMRSGQQVLQARNGGNECYAIQAITFLLSNPYIHDLLRNWPSSDANQMELYLKTLCYTSPNTIFTNIRDARLMVPQRITPFKDGRQEDAMEFIETLLGIMRIRDTKNARGQVESAAPVPIDVIGYTKTNKTTCTERHCEKDNVVSSEEFVYHIHMAEDSVSVNGCLRRQLENPEVSPVNGKCSECGVSDAIYNMSHTVTELKKCVILQLLRFTPEGKIKVPVKVDTILSVGPFKGYLLTSAILHKGESKNSGHYTGLIHDPNTGQWVFTDDQALPRAKVIEERVATERLRKEGYILFYSKPESFPEPLKGQQTNRQTVKEETRVPKSRVQQQMKPSSTRDQISTFKTDDRPIPINLPKMTHTSYLKNVQVHSPSEEELSARILPNQIETNQPIIDPNDQLGIKLRDIFGHQNFRSVEQLEATRAVIAGIKDVLVIMSTGTIFSSMFVFKHICFRKWQITHLPIGCNGEK